MKSSIIHRALLSRSPLLRSQQPHLSASFHKIPTTTTPSSRITGRRNNSDFTHLQSSLPARRLPLVYDYLTPTNSHLLNIAISDLLAPQPTNTSSSTTSTSSDEANATTPPLPHPALPTTSQNPTPLPPTHHLIYFPPMIPGPLLLPDGTDPLQSPGAPFVRRMWAGGSVRFANPSTSTGSKALTLSGARAVCLESIRDVAIKGAPGSEKVFVGIERRIGATLSDTEDDASVRSRLHRDAEDDWGDAAVIERRNIVFMRERSREQAIKDMETARTKMLAPPTGDKAFDITVLPDAKLLFRYSALTYNAHAIHLDPGYCREVEGHRGLLVHGPLSFTLMVTALRKCLREKSTGSGGEEEVVVSFDYRNLAPLYCGEPLRVCGKEREKGRWEVWAETPEGGVAVKGSARTEVAAAGGREGDLGMMGL